MSEHVIGPEMAQAEFERFCEEMALDVDTSAMDEEDRKALDEIRRILCARIMDGSLEINENGEPVYHPKSGGADITFYEPKGSAMMAIDSKRKSAEVAKTFAALASMTKQSEKRFVDMPMRDLKVCQNILKLFFG